jgi:hypothetical protein
MPGSVGGSSPFAQRDVSLRDVRSPGFAAAVGLMSPYVRRASSGAASRETSLHLRRTSSQGQGLGLEKASPVPAGDVAPSPIANDSPKDTLVWGGRTPLRTTPEPEIHTQSDAWEEADTSMLSAPRVEAPLREAPAREADAGRRGGERRQGRVSSDRREGEVVDEVDAIRPGSPHVTRGGSDYAALAQLREDLQSIVPAAPLHADAQWRPEELAWGRSRKLSLVTPQTLSLRDIDEPSQAPTSAPARLRVRRHSAEGEDGRPGVLRGSIAEQGNGRTISLMSRAETENDDAELCRNGGTDMSGRSIRWAEGTFDDTQTTYG